MNKKLLLLAIFIHCSLLLACRGDHISDTDTATNSFSTADDAHSQTNTNIPPHLSLDDEKGIAMPISINASISPSTGFFITAGDITLQLNPPSECIEESDSVVLCNKNLSLIISSTNRRIQQTLHPDAIYIDSKNTLYRGRLDDSYVGGGHSLVLTDIDGDGHDDLIIWSGREGAYGGASYEIYLFDPDQNKFVLSQELSDLTIGYNGLFTIENGQLKASATDSCCLHIFDTYAIENRRPKLIERITQDSNETPGKPKTKIEHLIEGEMQEVGTQ